MPSKHRGFFFPAFIGSWLKNPYAECVAETAHPPAHHPWRFKFLSHIAELFEIRATCGQCTLNKHHEEVNVTWQQNVKKRQRSSFKSAGMLQPDDSFRSPSPSAAGNLLSSKPFVWSNINEQVLQLNKNAKTVARYLSRRFFMARQS
jgi:hypothetical protein